MTEKGAPPESVQTPADTGNTLLAPTPTEFSMHEVMAPGGQKRLMVTIRTASTTLTIFLSREEAAHLSKHVGNAAAQMSGLVVPTIGMN